MAFLHKQRPFFMFQLVCFNHQFLHYYPWESIHIHHDGRDSFVRTTSVGGNVKIFYSLNLSPSSDLMKQIRVLYSPDITITPTVLKAELYDRKSDPEAKVIPKPNYVYAKPKLIPKWAKLILT